MKTVIRTAVILTIALLTSAQLGAGLHKEAVQATDVTGEWVFTVTTDQGGGTPTITFKQDGEKLTGKYDGQLGNADLTGTVKGNAITFTFTVDVQGQQAPVTYNGTVEKNTMKGKLDIARDGQRDVYRHQEVDPIVRSPNVRRPIDRACTATA